MIISGTITQAGQPSAPTGQFQVMYQDVTITDQQGHEWHGRIGSKQGYQAGAPISVTVEQKPGDSGPYNYFRKYNPQYPSQPVPQASQSPAGGQTTPKTTQDYQRPKTPAEADKIGRMWAITSALANIRNRVLAGDKTAIEADEYELATRYKYFADTGQKLKIPDQDHSNYPGPANPNYVGDNPDQSPEDGIPF